MIGMIPPGYSNPTNAQAPWLRSKTMYMSIPQLTQLLQSDDQAAAAAAQTELQQRGVPTPQVGTGNHAQVSPALRAAQIRGSAAGDTPADAVLGGALPGDQALQSGTANHPGIPVPPPTRAMMAPAGDQSVSDPGTDQNAANNAGAPGQPPPGLAMSQPQQTPSDAIKSGVEAADEAQDPLAGMSPALKTATAAMSQTEDPDSPIGNIVKSLTSESANPGLALAKAGFTMASSRNPYFFGALGEGANAGIDQYQSDQQRALLNKARAAGIVQDQQRQNETSRSNRVQEGQGDTRLSQAQQVLEQSKQEYQEKVREFNVGQIGSAEMRAADIKYKLAAAAASQAGAAESGARAAQIGTSYGTNDQGNMIQVRGTKATPVTDDQGNPVQAQKWGQKGNSLDTKIQVLRSLGRTDQEIGDVISGKKQLSQTEIVNAATNYAKSKTANDFGSDASTHFQQAYDEAVQSLTSGSVGGGNPPAVPSSTSPSAPATPAGTDQSTPAPQYSPGQIIIYKGQKYKVGPDGKTGTPVQ